jgi:hypothetical protein
MIALPEARVTAPGEVPRWGWISPRWTVSASRRRSSGPRRSFRRAGAGSGQEGRRANRAGLFTGTSGGLSGGRGRVPGGRFSGRGVGRSNRGRRARTPPPGWTCCTRSAWASSTSAGCIVCLRSRSTCRRGQRHRLYLRLHVVSVAVAARTMALPARHEGLRDAHNRGCAAP